ncbi:MAG: ABC transporter substrate-binding protein [Limnochordia bacterium]|jgi:multiple sugar transport system substrate-binding protein
MRRLMAMVLILCVIGMMTGSGVAAAKAKREVVVWMWTAHVTDLYDAWRAKITNWFEEDHPDATLRFEFVPFGADRILTAAASGVVPDATLASIQYARDLYEAGALMELDGYIAKTPHLTEENFMPASWVFCQKDGRTFGVPWGLEVACILYNKDHLAESGLDERPEALKTWDDLVSYAQRLRQFDPEGRLIRSGYVSSFNRVTFASYLYSNGGEFYDASGKKVAFNTEQGIQALEFMYDLEKRYDVKIPGAGTSALPNKTASMVYWETSAMNHGIEPVDPDFAQWLRMAPVPVGPQGATPSGVGWGNMFVIPRGAKNPDLGFAVMAIWMRPEVQVESFVHYGSVKASSSRRDFYSSPTFARAMRNVPLLASIPTILTYAKPYPYIRFPEINRQAAPLFSQVLNGTMAPAAALAESERIANIILAD